MNSEGKTACTGKAACIPREPIDIIYVDFTIYYGNDELSYHINHVNQYRDRPILRKFYEQFQIFEKDHCQQRHKQNET